jgi:hypothetical protein
VSLKEHAKAQLAAFKQQQALAQQREAQRLAALAEQ